VCVLKHLFIKEKWFLYSASRCTFILPVTGVWLCVRYITVIHMHQIHVHHYMENAVWENRHKKRNTPYIKSSGRPMKNSMIPVGNFLHSGQCMSWWGSRGWTSHAAADNPAAHVIAGPPGVWHINAPSSVICGTFNLNNAAACGPQSTGKSFSCPVLKKLNPASYVRSIGP